MTGVVEVVRVVRMLEVVGLVWVVEVIRVVEVIGEVRVVKVVRVVEVVYRYEEIFGVKGPKSKSNNNNNKDVGLRMTMPQAAGKKHDGVKARYLPFFRSLFFFEI